VNGAYNAWMVALRYVYVLALAAWLGGMVVLGAVVAPTTFQVLAPSTVEGLAPSSAEGQASAPGNRRALAGEVFGAILARFHYVAYAAGGTLLLALVAMRILGPRPHAFAFRAVLVLAMLLVALYSGIVILGTIDAIQASAGGLPSLLPVGDSRRIRFDELHRLSTRLMMANIAGTLVLLYWEARE
jgi:hypothetical protein